MAMLLAMYQKMRLIREKNQATLDVSRYTSKLKTVSKNIERVQKMYTSKIATLESQQKLMLSQGTSIFQNQFGLTMPNSSPYLNAGMAGSQNYYMQKTLVDFLSNGKVNGVNRVQKQNADGSSIEGEWNYIYDGQSSFTFEGEAGAMLQYYMSHNGKFDEVKDSSGKITEFCGVSDPSEDDILQVQWAINAAQYAYQTQYQLCQNANTNYQTNVSIWFDNAKAQLEAQQDEALEPLSYQQTMWELEKEQAQQRLELIKEELQSYRDLCKEESKDMAPHFGLG